VFLPHPRFGIVITGAMPAGTVGKPYKGQLRAQGGVKPYHWKVARGKLPPGLLKATGTISGTPTKKGAYKFLVRVTDSRTPPQQAQKQVSLTIR
jgi:large repetitive protein